MQLLLAAYMLVTVGVSAVLFFGAQWSLGLTLLLGSILGFWSTSGAKGSLLVGTPTQRRTGVISGIIFLVVAIALVTWSGVRVIFSGYSIDGIWWVVIGAAIGWLATNQRHAGA